MLDDLRFRLRALFRRGALDRDLADELQHHAAVAGSLPNADAIAESCRDARGVAPLETLGRDLRFSWRALRRNPAFSLSALLTLALGLGAAIAIFSVADAVLLQPLPYGHANRLVLLRERIRMVVPVPIRVSGPDIAYLRAAGPAFDAVGAYDTDERDLISAGAGSGNAQRLEVAEVSPNLFPMLDARPALGHSFAAIDSQPGHNEILLGDALWRSRFGGSPAILGNTVDLDGTPFTVAGIMPANFVFPPRGAGHGEVPSDAWVPLAFTPAQLADVGDNFDYDVIARLRPDASLAEARAQMDAAAVTVLHMWTAKAGPVPGLKLDVVADFWHDIVVAPARPLLLLLIAAAALLLLLSCANTANLFLVRADARQAEFALRAALGAGRGRLIRQAIAESTLLATFAGALGLAVAWLALRALAAAAPPSLPQVQSLGLSWPVAAFALLLAWLTGPTCGSLAARAAASGRLDASLRFAGRGLVSSNAHARWRQVLVVAQVAIASVLACGAGLLVRSFLAAESGGAGVSTSGRITASLALPSHAYNDSTRVIAFEQRLSSDLGSRPGIRSVTIATGLPTSSGWDHIFTVKDQPTPSGAKVPDSAHALTLGPYFRTLGIPLLQGRDFTADEQAGHSHVVIVSADLAQRYWPRGNALGRQLKWGPPVSKSPWLTVVGVAGNVKDGPLDSAYGYCTYSPYLQECAGSDIPGVCRDLNLVVHSELPSGELARQIRTAVASADPSVPVTGVRSLAAVLDSSITPRRFNTQLIALFGISALLLASIGLYGVLAFVVAAERRNLGVRLALGASRGQVLRLVLLRGILWAAGGLGVGLAGAFAARGVVAGLLYQTPTADPTTFAVVALLVLGVAVAACYFPARRASRLAPLSVLREE